jgi:hypothetical protein
MFARLANLRLDRVGSTLCVIAAVLGLVFFLLSGGRVGSLMTGLALLSLAIIAVVRRSR